jgi:DUF4097 and DUF4098 domain-containing protein YvlB
MRSNRRFANPRFATWAGAVLGVLLALMMNATLARAGDDDDDAVVKEEFHQTYPLTADGRIELENINGSVHISVWDQNQVKLDAVKRARDEKRLKNEEIRVTARPDSISIETHYRDSDDGWNHTHVNPGSVEYTLTVPRTARLGEIKLINGGLDVIGVNGEVRASCINGKLTARDLGGRAKLETINGQLNAEFARLASTLELSSVNGSVHLTLPSDAKATIEASTVHGSIDNDFGLHTNNHHFVGHDMQGQLGGGGTEIRLSNVNGSIEVRHASDGHALSPAKDMGERSDGDDEI